MFSILILITSTERAKEILEQRGIKELVRRGIHQIWYQLSERIFGSKQWFRIRQFLNTLQYETVQNPYDLEQIDPKNVTHRSARQKRTDGSRWKDIGRIVGGDWDLESKSPEHRIADELLYRAIEAHFVRGVPWEETEYVEKSLERLRQGGHNETWRAVVRSEEDLWERCDQLDSLYERITKDGYKSKRAVFESESNDPMGYYPRTYKYTLDEVMIDRARDGEPLLVDGQHRLFIAKVCGVEEIPVLVVVRHRKNVDDR